MTPATPVSRCRMLTRSLVLNRLSKFLDPDPKPKSPEAPVVDVESPSIEVTPQANSSVAIRLLPDAEKTVKPPTPADR